MINVAREGCPPRHYGIVQTSLRFNFQFSFLPPLRGLEPRQRSLHKLKQAWLSLASTNFQFVVFLAHFGQSAC